MHVPLPAVIVAVHEYAGGRPAGDGGIGATTTVPVAAEPPVTVTSMTYPLVPTATVPGSVFVIVVVVADFEVTGLLTTFSLAMPDGRLVARVTRVLAGDGLGAGVG